MDVICGKLYFGDDEEEALGQGGSMRSQHPRQKVYLSISGLFQYKKQGP